jgi:hypothetical protein
LECSFGRWRLVRDRIEFDWRRERGEGVDT